MDGYATHLCSISHSPPSPQHTFYYPVHSLSLSRAPHPPKDDNETLRCLAASTIANCAAYARNRRTVRRAGGIEKLVGLLRAPPHGVYVNVRTEM